MKSSSIIAIPMNGGYGPYSYTNNSNIQKRVIDAARVMIEEVIEHKLDIHASAAVPKAFVIADLGCSVGPNTFTAIQNIINAVNLKCSIFKGCTSSLSSANGESSSHTFHVFFNDHATNDFNTLFTSLPPDRQYFAAGVPGSFYTRLFPQDSVHVIHCSEAKIDSFNLPMYTTSPKEAEILFRRNENFSMERMEEIPFLNPATTVTPSYYNDHIRAAAEGVVESHFGSEIKDELFDHHYLKKLEESNNILQSPKSIMLFVILKRN
ncbi:hypothetical protein MKW94_005434 [Papaver nudicaule]|uniref:Uncharacterized protein n=1 Tax=Papaver nudicaule TaxID=74823 RepID=A0AA41RXR7_PAPNU|nr:hypothetical protein [Papaver nudicaule]